MRPPKYLSAHIIHYLVNLVKENDEIDEKNFQLVFPVSETFIFIILKMPKAFICYLVIYSRQLDENKDEVFIVDLVEE